VHFQPLGVEPYRRTRPGVESSGGAAVRATVGALGFDMGHRFLKGKGKRSKADWLG
jgi:hypothetical protein